MGEKSVLERLIEVNPEAEIWWDSSPIVYGNWRQKMIQNAADAKEMGKWLDCLYHQDNHPAENLFRGVTTNPPLSLNVIKEDPGYWNKWLDGALEQDRLLDTEALFWKVYKEIVKRGAEVYLPMFEASNYRYGYISGQLDPRILHDVHKMLDQALELAEISPNVMVKVPGTAEGYQVIERLTALGIPTNNTLSFVVPQFVECMNAVVAGLRKAATAGVDLYRWRSVITAMSSRYGTLGDLKQQAMERSIELSERDLRWAEIAIFKKACHVVMNNAEYPGKMLLCSVRMSPAEGDKVQCWHLEKVAGANVVYTLPPNFLAELLKTGSHLQFRSQIDEAVPQEVMDKLMRIPYFERGYAEDGYTPQEFNSHAALVATAREFSAATQQMVDFVAKRVARFRNSGNSDE